MASNGTSAADKKMTESKVELVDWEKEYKKYASGKQSGLIGGIIGSIVTGAICCVVSFVSNSWEVTHSGDHTYQVGLWESCNCTNTRQPDEVWFRSVQATMCIGLGGIFAALIATVVFLFIAERYKKAAVIVVGAICMASTLFFLAAMSVFGALTTNQHVGFYFACISGIAILVGGVLAFLHCWRLKR